MNRNDLKKLAKIRLTEAKTLLDNSNYNGAYYMSGYIVECGLKACFAKKTKKYDFPDKDAINYIWTHKLEKLVTGAGLTNELTEEIDRNKDFEINWAVVKDWDESSRYKEHTDKEAQDLYSAITNRRNGVFTWIKRHW